MATHWLNHPPTAWPHNPFVPPPVNHRLLFPPHEYHSRGAPVARLPKVTTYGYVVSNVPIGQGKLMQLPRPKDPSMTRTRANAFKLRPERSLSVKQILAGEYFARPDLDKFTALVYKERLAAADLAQLKADAAAAAAAAPAQAAPRRLAPLATSQSAPTLSTLPALRSDSGSVNGAPAVATLAPTSSAATLF